MKKYKMEATVGVFVLVGMLCVGYLAVKLGNVGFIGEDSYPIYARFTSVSGLRTGNSVEMLGIEVGRVGRLSMDQEEQVAVVELEIKKGVIIYDDAIASIKTTGLIGDKYIQLDPGGAGEALKEGDTITETEPSIDIGELIGKYAFGEVSEEKE
jgi:phospholipid/cholesterol/gamma-HCH transport system substrate-binding protein